VLSSNSPTSSDILTGTNFNMKPKTKLGTLNIKTKPTTKPKTVNP
jgi:hypothetical protein